MGGGDLCIWHSLCSENTVKTDTGISNHPHVILREPDNARQPLNCKNDSMYAESCQGGM
jgi:hypothetical protein